ncbi:MAG: bifunctional DNA-formamidopyrimidine glycosylase/DNA-(apurinic or apyrimidinic site) lyase [Acidimicrobiales bacterium]
MPELPEVETLRQDLCYLYVGRKLEQVQVMGRRTVRRHSPVLLASLEGDVLGNVGRHGKYLLFEWESGRVLAAHMRMSGQLLAQGLGAPLQPHTHAVLAFEAAGELRFVDPRTFGELFLSSGVAGAPARSVPELDHLGPDALQVGPGYLERVLAGRKAPLKSLLMDQRLLAGIGNIYADEICFGARLRPDEPAGALVRTEVRRLARAVRNVLRSATEKRGSTLADRQYVDLRGEAGSYQAEHRVYGRAGQPCAVCGQEIVLVRFGARHAYACLRCQR